MIKKRLFTTLAFLGMFTGMLLAQVAKGTVLVVELSEGGIQTFYLKDKPVVALDGDHLRVKSTKIEANFLRESIAQFYFSEATVDVEDVKQDELRFVFKDNNSIQLYGLGENDRPIRVFDLNGRERQAQVSMGDDTSAQVSLQSLPAGVYMLRIGNRQTIKIYKR